MFSSSPYHIYSAYSENSEFSDKENVISVRIDLVNYEHNHEFLKKDTEKGQLQCYKTHDRDYMEFLIAMQESRIPQHCIMNFVSEMHGGPENVPITV